VDCAWGVVHHVGMTEADEPPTPIDMDSDIDPDEIPEMTDALWYTGKVYRDGQYLGLVRDVFPPLSPEDTAPAPPSPAAHAAG
jgi:hypothetical protein